MLKVEMLSLTIESNLQLKLLNLHFGYGSRISFRQLTPAHCRPTTLSTQHVPSSSRAFSVAGPTVWNSPPGELRGAFRTFYFSEIFRDSLRISEKR